MTAKFCIDCKYHILNGQMHECIRPELAKGLVTGEKYEVSCHIMRYPNDCTPEFFQCGNEGKYWEAKDGTISNSPENSGEL